MINWGTIITALIAGIGGSIIGPVIAHKLGLIKLEKEHIKKIEYFREEIFFKRKIEYIDKLASKINETLDNLEKVIDNLKKGKISEPPYILGKISPLEYSIIFESRDFLDRIKSFEKIKEKLVNNIIEAIGKKDIKNEINVIDKTFKQLDDEKELLIIEMRTELKRGFPLLLSRKEERRLNELLELLNKK